MNHFGLDEDEYREFCAECEELLEEAESALLQLESGGDFNSAYNALFRSFHSVKGAASMLEVTELQEHMHQLENLLLESKDKGELNQELISYFLKGVDHGKNLLSGKKGTVFESNEQKNAEDLAITSKSESPKPSPKEGATPSKAMSLERPFKAFVVDDEPSITEIVSEQLKEISFEVVCFNDPTLVSEALEKEKPDLVVTDMKMPQMTGQELVKVLGAQDPDLPVIFLSGYLSKEVLMEAMSDGVFGAIEKPVKETELIHLCQAAAESNRLNKMMNRSLRLLLYQYPDLDRFLAKEKKESVRQTIKNELESLVEGRRKLTALRIKRRQESDRS
jgi:FixJ family two-component response regulator